MITYLGLLAAAITSTGPFLQMMKTVRTRETGHLSAGMWVSFCIGITLWLVYGVMRRDIPIIVANAATLLFSAVILGVMVRNHRVHG